MASDAADVILRVNRIDSVHVLRAAFMASHAALINDFRRDLLEGEYLGHVPAPGNVLATGTMTAFATLMGRPAFGIQGRLPVGAFFPAVVLFFVAGFAGL